MAVCLSYEMDKFIIIASARSRVKRRGHPRRGASHTPAGRRGGRGVSSRVKPGVAQAMPDDAQVDPSQTIAALRRELEVLTAERNEVLAERAAMAEIVQIINSSPGDLSPVLEAMLEKAMRLSDAAFGHIYNL